MRYHVSCLHLFPVGAYTDMLRQIDRRIRLMLAAELMRRQSRCDISTTQLKNVRLNLANIVNARSTKLNNTKLKECLEEAGRSSPVGGLWFEPRGQDAATQVPLPVHTGLMSHEPDCLQ